MELSLFRGLGSCGNDYLGLPVLAFGGRELWSRAFTFYGLGACKQESLGNEDPVVARRGAAKPPAMAQALLPDFATSIASPCKDLRVYGLYTAGICGFATNLGAREAELLIE